MQKKKLLKLAEGLESLTRAQQRHFDMNTWLETDYKYDSQGWDTILNEDGKIVLEKGCLPSDKSLSCGTAGCAMGWAPTFFPRSKLKMEQTYGGSFQPVYRCNGERLVGMDAASAMFGLTEKQAYYLFYPERYMNWRKNDLFEKITPKMVARRIRKMVETDGKSFEIDQKKYEKYWETSSY